MFLPETRPKQRPFCTRAWDTTFGTTGTAADTTVNGGVTAFSTATDTASLFVNDAPVLTPAAPAMGTTDEDTTFTVGLAGTFINGGAGTTAITDADINAIVGGIAVTRLAGRGIWSYSLDGSTFKPFGTISDASALLLPATAAIRYAPDLKNGEMASITYRAWDATFGTAESKVDLSNPVSVGGNAAFSDKTDTATLTVTDVNDAPVLTPASPFLGNTNSKAGIVVSLAGALVNHGAGTTTITDVDNGAMVGGIAFWERPAQASGRTRSMA